MKSCPACQIPLRIESYEGVRVDRCPQCRGSLLPGYRLDIIKHTREKDEATLRDEARTEFHGDTRRSFRCPHCQATMEKQALSRRYSDLCLDLCRTCKYVWLDGGELALAQLLFEHSTVGQDIQEMQRRTAELEASPERRAAFAEALRRLPEDLPSGPEENPTALAVDVLLDILLRHR